MGGPNEAKLEKVVSAHPAEIYRAAGTWTKAADGLKAVAEQIDSAKAEIEAAWSGKDATAATAAFTTLSTNVRRNEERMRTASAGLNLAGDGLKDAKQAYANLPVPPPLPSSPEPGATGEISPEDEVRYIRLAGQHYSAVSARETQAGTAYASLTSSLGDAQKMMTDAAPAATQRDSGGNPPIGQYQPSGGSTSGGGGATPVGPYSTSTSGTHVHAPGVTGATSGGLVTGSSVSFGQVHAPSNGLLPGLPTHDGPTADGVVGGGAPGTIGGPALGTPGTPTIQPGTAGGSTGSLAGGAVGGLAGMLGGAGGALGALRGGASSAGSSLAGRLGGMAGGPIGGVSGSPTSAVGGAARGTLGSVGSAGKGGMLGASPTAGTGPNGAGRSGLVPGGSGTAGGSGSSGAGARGSSGRYASATEEQAAAGRGSRTSAGMRSGGRGVAAEGAAGRGTGTGGSTGSTKDDRTAKRKSMVFEDDDAWLDDDESGPDVIR